MTGIILLVIYTIVMLAVTFKDRAKDWARLQRSEQEHRNLERCAFHCGHLDLGPGSFRKRRKVLFLGLAGLGVVPCS